jgi:hypothetical protein
MDPTISDGTAGVGPGMAAVVRVTGMTTPHDSRMGR